MDKKMTIKEKILTYIEMTGKTKAEFFKSIGAAPSNFKGAGKSSALNSDKVAEILTLYPDLSPDWLLNGIGEMIRPQKKYVAEMPHIPIEDKLLTIIENKDITIREQAEEIGKLKQRIQELTQRLEKTAGDANIEHTANAG